MAGIEKHASRASTAPGTERQLVTERSDTKFPRFFDTLVETSQIKEEKAIESTEKMQSLGLLQEQEEEEEEQTETPLHVTTSQKKECEWHIRDFVTKDPSRALSEELLIIDRMEEPTAAERDRVLSIDKSYIRALALGPERLICPVPQEPCCRAQREKHISGPHWMFDEIERREISESARKRW